MSSDIDLNPVTTAATPQAADPPPVIAAGRVRQAPAWAISMLVHVIVLLAMALIVSEPPSKPVVREITSSAPEAVTEFTEFQDERPESVDTPADATAEMAVAAEVVALPTEVVADVVEADAAPPADILGDFGAETAPASTMLASIETLGAAAGGLGGRGQAANLVHGRGGGSDTELAVDRGLQWISGHQLPDGGWSFDFKECPTCLGRCGNSRTSAAADRSGATALALLPFLGRGYTHRDGKYRATVARGIDYLRTLTEAGNGKAYRDGGTLYSQGLAGIALCECYAMTQDKRLAKPAQLALNYIMQCQDPVGGGWRYAPREPGDTSAFGWQIMALKSGNMASLLVDPLTIKKAEAFLNYVESRGGARYGYVNGDRFSPSLTAVGLLCRMYLGWKKDRPALEDGVAYLAATGPTDNLYYDYYATQVMQHAEGDPWIAWNSRMKPILLATQATSGHEAGSWFDGVDGGGHSAEVAGRLYCTSLATMILEVYYRYLPIYGSQSVAEEFRE